jgi:hypothetical protein
MVAIQVAMVAAVEDERSSRGGGRSGAQESPSRDKIDMAVKKPLIYQK